MAMRGGIPVPGKGDKMHASWGAAVASRVNELCSMAPAGMLARDGVGGSGTQPLPQNNRNPAAKSHLHPYTIKWIPPDPDDAEAEGYWIIWLPSEWLLIVEGNPVDVREFLAAADNFPAGWYVLDVLPADESASLYLSIDMNAATRYAEFADAPGGLGDGSIDVLISEISYDSETEARSITQLVWSVITIGGEPAELRDTYGCDERSISLIRSMSGESPDYGHYFHIEGFGKFTVPGAAAPYGTYAAPSVLTLGDSPSEVAALVRVGNSDQPNSNFLEFRTLRVGGNGTALPACFDLVSSTTESGGNTTTTHTLVRCYYNIGGTTGHQADINISSLIANVAAGSILAFAKEGYSGGWGARLFADSAALAMFQGQSQNYAVPLYVMSGNGAEVLADLRNAPQIQMVETLS